MNVFLRVQQYVNTIADVTSIERQQMLKKVWYFSGSFAVVGLAWILVDYMTFGQFGWIITFMFSTLLTVCLTRAPEKVEAEPNGSKSQ
jgi:hypothetical protein